jgi:hypothetical protein
VHRQVKVELALLHLLRCSEIRCARVLCGALMTIIQEPIITQERRATVAPYWGLSDGLDLLGGDLAGGLDRLGGD